MVWVLFCLGSNLLLIGLAIPLILRRIPRNLLYGFRTPRTLSSDRVWYPANAYAGRRMAEVGCAGALAAVVLSPLAAINLGLYFTLWGAATVIPLLVNVVRCFAYLRGLEGP